MVPACDVLEPLNFENVFMHFLELVTEHFSQGFGPFCSFPQVLPVLNATLIVVFHFSPLFVVGQEAEQWRSDIEDYVEQLRTWFTYVKTLDASANFPTIDFDSIANSLGKFWMGITVD